MMKIVPVTYTEAARTKNILISLFKGESVEKEKIFLSLSSQEQSAVKKLWGEEFRAEDGETKSMFFPSGPVKRVQLFGWGEKSKWHRRKNQLVARRYVKYAKAERVAEFVTTLNFSSDATKKEEAMIFAANAVMAEFDFNKYKETPKEGWPTVNTIYLAADARDHAEIKKGVAEGMIIGEEVNNCRTLANTPGGDITPEKLARVAADVARKNNIKIKILGEKEIDKIGMGGLIGVSKGSTEKPRFIIMEYLHGPKTQKPLILVGKGVTFDTGGLSLKPEQFMYEMHMDMSGGAAVIQGLAAIARLKLSVNVIGLVPAVENMPSGSSFRPGDILKSLSGKTIEVLNTDAEGRIILADALAYSLRYKPGFILDLATLTGAAHVALGNYCSALFTNKDTLQKKLVDMGSTSGDQVWPLPLWEEYLGDIKGTFADLANAGKQDRYGGAIQGAKFLEQFVGDFPWAHLDIAPRMTTVESDCLAKGASGVGVRYIVELAKNYKDF